MRIIAGSRKGHTIYAPKGSATRPTGDRVREAAFNLIGPVDGATVLDLYAGSGAMGLEALSRGAARAVFVESDREACRTIDRNLEKLRLTGAVVVRDGQVRVTAIMIDNRSGEVTWSELFELSYTDVGTIPSAIARTIVEAWSAPTGTGQP